MAGATGEQPSSKQPLRGGSTVVLMQVGSLVSDRLSLEVSQIDFFVMIR